MKHNLIVLLIGGDVVVWKDHGDEDDYVVIAYRFAPGEDMPDSFEDFVAEELPEKYYDFEDYLDCMGLVEEDEDE